MSKYKPDVLKEVSDADAEALFAAAKAYAQGTIRKEVYICIVGLRGNVKLHRPTGQSKWRSEEISLAKARTAERFEASTLDIAAKSQPGQPMYGVQFMDGVNLLEGGLPIIDTDGTVIGGIGVSAALPSEDGKIAQAALDAMH